MVALVLIGFFVARSRARRWRRRQVAPSPLAAGLPRSVHHGVGMVPMLLVFVIGSPLLGRFAISAALPIFPPEVAADELSAGLCCAT